MSLNASKWTFLTFCFCVPFFMTSFHSFSILASPSAINIAWDERFFLVLLGFPRHASLRDGSPESSEPYVTLDSGSSLIRTTFGVHTSFFPSSHLRVSRTPRIFLRFTCRILSHRYTVLRDETTCACFHLQRKIGEELS